MIRKIVVLSSTALYLNFHGNRFQNEKNVSMDSDDFEKLLPWEEYDTPPQARQPKLFLQIISNNMGLTIFME